VNYVLEKISIEDKKKIIANAGEQNDTFNLLVSADRENVFPESWAIDRDSGHYLFSAPIMVRSDSLDRPYFFNFNGKLVCFSSEGQDGVWFKFNSDLTTENRSLIIEEIESAFAVYGRWGSGPLNKRGKPTFFVVPKFRDEV
jgi:hypothetical protein